VLVESRRLRIPTRVMDLQLADVLRARAAMSTNLLLASTDVRLRLEFSQGELCDTP
jgi:hypothetical protein